MPPLLSHNSRAVELRGKAIAGIVILCERLGPILGPASRQTVETPSELDSLSNLRGPEAFDRCQTAGFYYGPRAAASIARVDHFGTLQFPISLTPGLVQTRRILYNWPAV